MKRLYILVLTIAFVFSNNIIQEMHAQEMTSTVRVGLTYKYKNVESVPIANQNIFIGYELGEQFFESANLFTSTEFSMKHTNLYYVRLEPIYSDYVMAKEIAASIQVKTKNKTSPCLIDVNKWVLYMGGYATESEAIAINNSIEEEAIVVKASNKAALLLNGDTVITIFDNQNAYPQIKAADSEFVDLVSRKYRGRVEFVRYPGENLTAVNVLTANEYLYSVVPAEMPSSWHIEALKSQACAARTYMLANINKHSESGYGLCDSTHCQVYLGGSNEAISTTQAVELTENIGIYYNDEIIEAVFFSSSGGMTENSENVWSATVPYMRSVKEINENMAKEWSRIITLDELNAVMTAKNANIGTATGMFIASYNNVGRVEELVITGTAGNKSIYKEEIRTYFSSLKGGSLESRNFSLSTGTVSDVSTNVYVTNGNQVIETPLKSITALKNGNEQTLISGNVTVVGSGGISTYNMTSKIAGQTVNANTNADIVVIGKGWGHGVGLSQFGAKGMAEIGYTYDQILKHYYAGVEVKQH